MFTGIIEGAGFIRSRREGKGHLILQIQASFSLSSIKKGESISVNGCCLTVTKKEGKCFWTDLSQETLKRTNLGRLQDGERVNLERAVRLSDRMGGHLVSGHVDGIGRVVSINRNGAGVELTIGFSTELRPYLIPKGSIAVDGVSMTVNHLTKNRFTLVIIPHTLSKTNLGDHKVGDPVNLEVDMVGKYIVNYLRKRSRR
ncbi:MAG: riboflavin synthase [Deltaproteobacteria bacterium]|nr:riboflavin synthase [Deltaproteobacteria bacterium]